MKQKDKKLHVGVKSLIVNKDKKILLLKRNLKKYSKPRGVWDIPGGRIKVGSKLLANLKREIFEETKISKLKIISLFGAQDIFHHDKEYYHVVRLTYISRVTNPKVVLDHESLEFRWVALDELMKIPKLDKYLKQLIKDKNSMSFIKDTIK